MATDEIVQGAIGPGERLEWRFTAPSGVNLSTVATRQVVMLVNAKSGREFTLSPWTEIEVTPSFFRVVYVPNGTEFVELGEHDFLPTLSFDGVVFRYQVSTRKVVPRKR